MRITGHSLGVGASSQSEYAWIYFVLQVAGSVGMNNLLPSITLFYYSHCIVLKLTKCTVQSLAFVCCDLWPTAARVTEVSTESEG